MLWSRSCKNFKQLELVWQRHLARTTGVPNVMMPLAVPVREALFPYVSALVRTYCDLDEALRAGARYVPSRRWPLPRTFCTFIFWWQRITMRLTQSDIAWRLSV